MSDDYRREDMLMLSKVVHKDIVYENALGMNECMKIIGKWKNE